MRKYLIKLVDFILSLYFSFKLKQEVTLSLVQDRCGYIGFLDYWDKRLCVAYDEAKKSNNWTQALQYVREYRNLDLQQIKKRYPSLTIFSARKPMTSVVGVCHCRRGRLGGGKHNDYKSIYKLNRR